MVFLAAVTAALFMLVSGLFQWTVPVLGLDRTGSSGVTTARLPATTIRHSRRDAAILEGHGQFMVTERCMGLGFETR